MKLHCLLSLSLLLSVAPLQVQAANAPLTPASMAIYEDGWHAVKDLFITQPQAEASRAPLTWAASAAGAVAAGFATWKGLPYVRSLFPWLLTMKLQDKLNNPTESVEFLKLGKGKIYITNPDNEKEFFLSAESPLLGGLISIAAAVGGWKLAKWASSYRILRAAERKHLEQVLDAWKQIRDSFPAELQPAFDTLHQLRSQNSPDYVANAVKTIAFAQELVKKHFAKSLFSRIMEYANS